MVRLWLVRVSLCLSLALLVAGCQGVPSPRAVQGWLDLSRWPGEAGQPVRLDGQWEFYWGVLLEPADFQRPVGLPTPRYLDVPGAWEGQPEGSGRLPRDGYGTYRLRVRLPPETGPMILSVGYVCSAYRLWVDDQLVAVRGTVATEAGAERPQYVPAAVPFTPASDTVQLVMQVSNFHHRCNGVWGSLQLGLAGPMEQQRDAQLGATMALFGAIVVMSVYHLVVYSLRPGDRGTLYLGLFCLLIALRTLVTGQEALVRVFPSVPSGVELRLEYLTGYLALPLFLLLLRSLYPLEVSRQAVRLAWAVAIPGLLSLALPIRSASLFIPAYEAILVLFVVYCIVALVRAVRNGRDGARLFLAGGAVFFAALIHDILVYNLVLGRQEVLPVGVFALLLSQSIILAQRFSQVFGELQRSRRMLTEREEHLRKEIAELLHGRVQTRLLVAGHRLAEAERRLDPASRDVASLLAAVREELDGVRQEDIRRASHLLHPSIIQLGIVPAARQLAGQLAGRFQVGWVVDPRLDELDDNLGAGLPEPVRLGAYRILEEALNNVATHAGARRVQIRLELSGDGQLFVQVRDDGQGMDVRQVYHGLGLRSIAARVAELGGTWELASRPGKGTVLSVWLPLSDRRPGEKVHRFIRPWRRRLFQRSSS